MNAFSIPTFVFEVLYDNTKNISLATKLMKINCNVGVFIRSRRKFEKSYNIKCISKK